MDTILKCYSEIDPKIDWSDFIIDHIWKFYNSITLCWTIYSEPLDSFQLYWYRLV